jgi:hypothetical protein
LYPAAWQCPLSHLPYRAACFGEETSFSHHSATVFSGPHSVRLLSLLETQDAVIVLLLRRKI